MLNRDKAHEFLIRHDSSKFPELTDEKATIIRKIICSIKLSQMIRLTTSLHSMLIATVSVHVNVEQLTNVLDLITMTSIDPKQAEEIFWLQPGLDRIDRQIQQTLSMLGVSNVDVYKVIHWLRHFCFLGKPTNKSDPLAIPATISEYLLQADENNHHISRYFNFTNKNTDIKNHEFEIFKEAFPDKMLENKAYRIKAHELISLSLYEIQCLLVDFVDKLRETRDATSSYAPVDLTGPLLDNYNNYTKAPLIKRIKENDKTVFETLKDDDAVNAIDYHTGRTLLSYAVSSQNSSFVDTLLAMGADPKSTDIRLRSCLHYAMEEGCEQVVVSLINAKCILNAEDEDKYTPMYIGAELGHANLVDILLKEKANPYLANNHYGASPLAIACRNGNVEVVVKLLNNGVLVDISKDSSIGKFQHRELKTLVDALKSNVTLTYLRFKSDQFNNAEIQLLIEAFEENCSLTEIRGIQNNEISKYLARNVALRKECPGLNLTQRKIWFLRQKEIIADVGIQLKMGLDTSNFFNRLPLEVNIKILAAKYGLTYDFMKGLFNTENKTEVELSVKNEDRNCKRKHEADLENLDAKMSEDEEPEQGNKKKQKINDQKPTDNCLDIDEDDKLEPKI